MNPLNELSPVGVLTERDRLQIQARAHLELRARETRNYREYVNMVRPGFVWYRHCEVVGEVLEAVAAGEIQNAMFFMPPRHSKSEMVSRCFSGYYVRKYPDRWVGLASYSSALARGLSRDARDRFAGSGGQIRQDVRGVMEWMTPEGGGMWSAGVGGPITGKGFNLGVIDDPYKNQEEARSVAVRRARNDWYEGVWLFRREPNASQILVMTRWNDLDMAGFILDKETEIAESLGWHVVALEAEKLATTYSIPKTCTLEDDWREPGEPLCPERFDKKALAKIKANSGRFWHAEWQQRPTADEGDVWKRDWFAKAAASPDLIRWPRKAEDLAGKSEQELVAIEAEDAKKIRLQDIGNDWDTAYTESEENSASAFVRMGRSSSGDIYVIGLGWDWYEFPDLVRRMEAEGGPDYVEKKATGKSAVQVLRKAGRFAREVAVSGADKISRAKMASVAVETGRVHVLTTLLTKLLDDQKQGILNFPNGAHDDLNDAFVQGINRLWRKPQLRLTILGRNESDE